MTEENVPRVLRDMIFSRRSVTINMTRAMERRLRAYVARGLASDPPDCWPEDETTEERMAFAVAVLMEGALEESERDAGLIARLDGYLVPRTRKHRGRLRTRLRRAWRELR